MSLRTIRLTHTDLSLLFNEGASCDHGVALEYESAHSIWRDFNGGEIAAASVVINRENPSKYDLVIIIE